MFGNPAGEQVTFAVFTNGSAAPRHHEVLDLDDLAGTRGHLERRAHAHLGISHRARQNRRVSRAVVLQGDDLVHWIADLAQFIASLVRLATAGWNRLVSELAASRVYVREPSGEQSTLAVFTNGSTAFAGMMKSFTLMM